MLVGASPRRVAIVGGARIPFVRGNGAYAQVGNQEMLTATLRAVVERFGLQGPASGRRRGRRGHEALESVESDARVGAGVRAGRGNARPRSAACLRHQSRSGDFARQQDSAGPDRVRDCRGCRHRERPARGLSRRAFNSCCCEAIAASPSASAWRRGLACARRICARFCRESQNPAPACRWAKARNSW